MFHKVSIGWFRRTQDIKSIGLFYKNLWFYFLEGVWLWRISGDYLEGVWLWRMCGGQSQDMIVFVSNDYVMINIRLNAKTIVHKIIKITSIHQYSFHLHIPFFLCGNISKKFPRSLLSTIDSLCLMNHR